MKLSTLAVITALTFCVQDETLTLFARPKHKALISLGESIDAVRRKYGELACTNVASTPRIWVLGSDLTLTEQAGVVSRVKFFSKSFLVFGVSVGDRRDKVVRTLGPPSEMQYLEHDPKNFYAYRYKTRSLEVVFDGTWHVAIIRLDSQLGP